MFYTTGRATGREQISPLPEPRSYAGPAAAIWMMIGVVYLVVLMTTRPAKIAETKRVFADTDDELESTGP